MKRVEELLHRWQDGVIGTDEVAELTALLESADGRRALVSEFCFAQAAREALALADAETQDVRDDPRRAELAGAASTGGRRAPWALALAAALAVAALAGLWLSRRGPTPADDEFARVAEVSGDVEVLSPSGDAVAAAAGQRLFAGQTLRTGDDGFAVVAYPDDTRLELHADTVVRLPQRRSVVFSGGVVRAAVPPRGNLVLSAPQVTVKAGESRLSLASSGTQATFVDVEAGNAELTRQADGRVVEMNAGECTVATMDLQPPVVQPRQTPLTRPARAIEFRQARAVAYADELRLASPRALRLVERGQPTQTPLLGGKKDGQVAFSRRGEVVAASAGGQVGVWELGPTRLRKQWGNGSVVSALALSDDGRRLVTLDAKKTVSAHDADGTERHHVAPAGVKQTRGLALSGDGATAAVGCLARGAWSVRLIDAESGKVRRQLDGQGAAPRLLAFSPDGKALAVAATDGAVTLYDVATGGLLRRIAGRERVLWSLCFAPDGGTLAGGSGDGRVWLWRVADGELTRTIEAGQRAVLALAFSDDGSRLATCGQAMPVREWDSNDDS